MVWDRANRPIWLRYSMGIIVVIIAASIRWQFHDFLGFHANFLTFYAPIASAALYGGLGPGLLATIASAILADLFWAEPVGEFAILNTTDWVDFGIFVSTGTLVSWLIEITRRAQMRMQKAEGQLKLAAEREKTEKERKKLIQVRLDLIYYAVTHTLDELLSKALDKIGEIVESPIGFYQFVEKDQKTLSLQQWSTRTLDTFCKAKYKGRHYSIDQAGVWADCVRERKPVIHNDYGSLEYKKGMPEGHAKVIRELVVPVMRADSVVAILGVGNKPMDYTEIDAETVAYLADVMWEIIEHKRDEEKIRQNEITLRTVLNQLPSGVTVWDASTGALILANVRAREIAGTLADDTAQFSHYRGFYPDGRGYRVEDWPFFRSMTKGEFVDLEEMEYERPDGVRCSISMSSVPICDSQGQIIMSACVFQDVTERKRAEQRLRESDALLTESEKISHLGSWSLDLRTNRLTWSDEVYRIFGLEPQEFGATYEAFLEAVHPEDRKAVYSAYSSSLQEKQGSYDIEHRIVRKHTGEVRFVQEKCVHQRDKAGKVIRSVGMVLDITERKRGEEERKKLEEQLFQAQKMESVGRLAGGVAHDFNNMLGVIIGRAEIAMQQAVSNNELLQNLKEILNAGLRSADLTRQLLAFARKQTAILKILDLNVTISSMLKMLRRLIGEDIDLHWIPGPDLWKVKMDPSQVDQILANLVVNARDAIAGIGAVTIRTENVAIYESTRDEVPEFVPGDYVLLTVSDTGEGMSNEVRENIFEPFFTTKELGKGTGLGLSTVYGIVKQNDGFIDVASELGKGSTFTIYLPKFDAETARVPSEEAAGKRHAGTETILLVEDDEAILKLCKLILKMRGYTVHAVRDPVEAIRFVEEHSGNIHLLITDVVMPEMNGRELAERLSAFLPNLKCLYMSGYTADVIAHRGIIEEGVNFIQKPFLGNDLAGKVREVLDHLR